MNKGIVIGVAVVVVAVIVGGVWWLAAVNSPAGQNAKNNLTTGTIYASFTDAAANMGNVTAVDMTVDKFYLHSQTQGWVTVSSSPQTFSLLALNASNQSQLMGQANVPVDTYDQVWFHASGVVITETGKAPVNAVLPSGDFKMVGIVKVNKGGVSTVNLDVFADQSLHKTDKGVYVFAPVVNFESRENPTVAVNANNIITIADGLVDSNTSAGMDIDGQVKSDFKLSNSSVLQINNGVINIKGAASTNTNVNANNGVNVNVGY